MHLNGHIWQQGGLRNVILILDHHVPSKNMEVLKEEGEMDIGGTISLFHRTKDGKFDIL